MKPLEDGTQIGTIHEVGRDSSGVFVTFSLFPGWEIDRDGFLRSKNRQDQDSTDDHDDGTMAGYSMHG